MKKKDVRVIPKKFAEIEQKQAELHIEMATKKLYHIISKNAKPSKNSALDYMCEFLNWDFELRGVCAKAAPNYKKNEVEVEYYK